MPTLSGEHCPECGAEADRWVTVDWSGYWKGHDGHWYASASCGNCDATWRARLLARRPVDFAVCMNLGELVKAVWPEGGVWT